MRDVWGGSFTSYFAWVGGKRVRYLYIDLARRLVGSRENLGAVYTSSSIRNTKQEQPWRQLQRARRGRGPWDQTPHVEPTSGA